MAHFTLLTGATGLVGSYLMRDLLRKGQKLAVIVRCSERRSAAKRVDSILSEQEVLLGERLARPVCLEGNVNHAHLGLSSARRRWVARNCCRIIHNAAALKFKESDRALDPWKTNCVGTRRVLNFCRRAGIRQLHYVSTAYVCGKRKGVILERELAEGQEFRNDYEHSKFLAEQMVRDDDYLDKPTIYRPVAIAGDSETGHTTSYHGVYVYLRFLSSLFRKMASSVDGKSSVPLRIALQGDERRNLVPVNWVSEVICHLVASPTARGLTYHLAPQVPITARLLLEAVYAYYSSDGVQFRGPDWDRPADLTIAEAGFLSHSRVYKDYERDDPDFDTSRLRRRAGHILCPTIDRAVIHRYLHFGECDQWGKRSGSKWARRAAA